MGVEVALSVSLAFRADERGVTLIAATGSLLGVLGAFTRGVGGSDRTEGVFATVGLTLPVGVPATRGVRGLRVVRLAASVGLSGRFVLRSEDIGSAVVAYRSHRAHPLELLPARVYRTQTIPRSPLAVTDVLLSLSSSHASPSAVVHAR